MAASQSGKGYWLVASDGGVFAFGDAGFFGSTAALHLHFSRSLAWPPIQSGKGYWLVASDGGVFAFGDAGFFGSTGGRRLDRPVVGMAPTATGNGYWLVAADGGLFTFGDAVFRGGTGAMKLKSSVVGMAATQSGKGLLARGCRRRHLRLRRRPLCRFGRRAAPGRPGGLGGGDAPGARLLARRFGRRQSSYGEAGFAGSLARGMGGVPPTGAAGAANGKLRLAAPIVALAPRPVIVPAEVSIFFYPWYATPATAPRTGYRHWEQNGHTPPYDIGANFYPAGGLYSSLDLDVLARQAGQMAASGVDTVVSSWWGKGAYEDWMLPDLVTAVRAAGLRLAIHLEPYKGRTPATVAGDLAYLRALGITDVYVYQADTAGAAADWAPVTAAQPDMRFFAESGNLGSMLSGSFADYARTAGFDGIYTYDAVRYGAAEMAATCGAARQRRLLCCPVGGAGLRRPPVRLPNLGVVPGRRGRPLRPPMEGGLRRRCRRRQHHQLERVARGHPDRAGQVLLLPVRRLLLPRLRRRLRPLRNRGPDGLHGPPMVPPPGPPGDPILPNDLRVPGRLDPLRGER